MDLGTQLDAAIDIGQVHSQWILFVQILICAVGQVQGAFVQVLGYLLTEECKWDEQGKQMHLGTWE